MPASWAHDTLPCVLICVYVGMYSTYMYLYVNIICLCTTDCPSQPGGTGAKPLNQSNRPAHSPTSQPNNHAHQNDNPHNLEEGSVVQYGDRPHYGVIKWIGKFPDHREIWFAGLDMVGYYVCGILTLKPA